MMIEPTPQNSPWHRRIVSSQPIPNTKTGQQHVLECGHTVQTFGRLELLEEHTGGLVMCTQCRDTEGAR